MPPRAIHTDEDLAFAVASSHSWRGVLRALGRNEKSAGALRAVRRQVDALDIDHSHFTGQRRWSDRQLAGAVSSAGSWAEVSERLGLCDSGTVIPALRSHALRLSLDTSHLTTPRPQVPSMFRENPKLERLRIAAASFAAAWFQLRGYEVLSAQEGSRYDLVVGGEHGFCRVQVKSTIRSGTGRVAVISGTRQGRRAAYDVGEIDQFFIIDRHLDGYLIPFNVVAGLQVVSLEKYVAFRVVEGGRWLEPDPVSAGASPGP